MDALDIDRLIAMLNPSCNEETLTFVKSALITALPHIESSLPRSDQQTVDPFDFTGPINDPRYW
jgi:hypothetical protein